MNPQRNDYIVTAVVLLLHVVLLAVGFNVLAAVFQFPEILREPADVRFSLFAEHSGIIIPTYYVLALTGLTQIALSVLLGQVLDDNRTSLVSLTVVFGVLAGLLQVMGFIRWPVLIPWLVESWQAGTPLEQAALLEGAFNRYVGMASGEHVGFLCQAIWTTLLGISMLGRRLFDRSLGWVGVAIGVASFPMAMEPLGGPFAAFAVITVPVNGALYWWLVLLAISLLRTPVPEGRGVRIGWRLYAVAAVGWAISITPALARIPHQLATAAADSTATSRPSPSGPLDVLPSTPSAPSGPRAANLRHSRRPRYATR